MGKMIHHFTPEFMQRLHQRANSSMKKLFKRKMQIFQKNPHDPQLDNHPLDHKWHGYCSFDVTPDWIVVFKEKPGKYYLLVSCGDKTRVLRPWMFPDAEPDWTYLKN